MHYNNAFDVNFEENTNLLSFIHESDYTFMSLDIKIATQNDCGAPFCSIGGCVVKLDKGMHNLFLIPVTRAGTITDFTSVNSLNTLARTRVLIVLN